MAAALAAGVRLTVPPSDFTPPEQVKLTYPAEGAFFKMKIHYADGEADMRTMGRVGSFTMAEYWKAVEPDPEQKELFGLLQKMLDDPADPVRLQAAYYLSLLRDPRTEPAVAQGVPVGAGRPARRGAAARGRQGLGRRPLCGWRKGLSGAARRRSRAPSISRRTTPARTARKYPGRS